MNKIVSKLFHGISFIFFIIVCFCGWRVAKKFGIITLDQMIFHLMAPMDGVDKTLILWAVRYACFTILIICSYFLFVFNSRISTYLIKVPGIKIFYRPQKTWWHILCGVFFISTAACYAEIKYDAGTWLFAEESPFIREHYAACQPEDVRFPQKRNAVVLILESMENTYNNTAVFEAPLLPKIQGLQKENVSFFQQKQLYGTGWTIAGLTSYFFGLPLLLFKNEGNVLFNTYMKNAGSIFEILEHHGYSIEYVVSSAAVFAGTDKMFNTHSHASVYDSVYLEKIKTKNTTGIWGVPDSFMYTFSKQRYEELSKRKEPFVLMVQTIDTHGYDGYVEHENRVYNDFRDVLMAADTMAFNFIEWLKNKDNFKNTTVIVLGDHLTGNNPMYKKYLIPNNEKRTIFNMFINSFPDNASVDKNRLCSSLDMAPTLIEAIGGILPQHKFGLGVSLFSGEKTLLEEFGENAVNNLLKQKSDFYRSLF